MINDLNDTNDRDAEPMPIYVIFRWRTFLTLHNKLKKGIIHLAHAIN